MMINELVKQPRCSQITAQENHATVKPPKSASTSATQTKHIPLPTVKNTAGHGMVTIIHLHHVK